MKIVHGVMNNLRIVNNQKMTTRGQDNLFNQECCELYIPTCGTDV
jgi:hypothetical protein